MSLAWNLKSETPDLKPEIKTLNLKPLQETFNHKLLTSQTLALAWNFEPETPEPQPKLGSLKPKLEA